MNNITKAFAGKKAFIPFITGGDPDIETTEKLLIAMAQAGADVIEIGIPFSDPIAEGPVIQEADERALKNGCTVDRLFDLVSRVRGQIAVPLLFMTYYNPVFRYGNEAFLQRCQASGIDGLIIPDLPFEEKGEIEPLCGAYGVTLISMITPASAQRVEQIAGQAAGFLYCVSSLGVTGMRSHLDTQIGEVISRVRRVTDVPCAIGFGIATPQQGAQMAALADGVIVGSAIVSLIAQHGRDCITPVCNYIKSMKEGIEHV